MTANRSKRLWVNIGLILLIVIITVIRNNTPPDVNEPAAGTAGPAAETASEADISVGSADYESTNDSEFATGDTAAVESSLPTQSDRDSISSTAEPPAADNGRVADSGNSPRGPPSVSDNAEEELGQLTEIRRRVFESTAGLIYPPGSAQGHRIDHVMTHAEDIPNKTIHGVFDGDRPTVLALLDEAWLAANAKTVGVRREEQGDRTVLTVPVGRRIGYVGGRVGQEDGHPECRHVRLVLEGREVITAYPLVP